MIWIVRRDNDTMKADYVAMYFIDKYTIGHYFRRFYFVPFYFANTTLLGLIAICSGKANRLQQLCVTQGCACANACSGRCVLITSTV